MDPAPAFHSFKLLKISGTDLILPEAKLAATVESLLFTQTCSTYTTQYQPYRTCNSKINEESLLSQFT